MFPNKSSSYEISSKTNAFVQNNDEEDKSESLRGMAQPPRPTSPTQQVPEKRDVMVVDIGVRVEGDPVLTVIANHPSQAPAKIPSSQTGDCESDGSSKMPLAETRRTGALCLDSIKSSRVNDTISIKDNLITYYRSESSTHLSNIPLPNDNTDQEVKSFKICDYYTRWGIPQCFKLLGGGESSLTTGTTGWGSPPNQSGSTGWNSSNSTSGGNNTASTSGQGGAGQTPAPASGGQTWGNTQNNSTNNGNNNNNNNGSRSSNAPGGSGAGVQQQSGGGPPSQSTASPAATAPTSTVTTTPPSSAVNTSNNNTTTTSAAQQNGSTGGQGTGSTWAAAAGKGLPPSSTTTTPTSTGSTSTKQQMEQLNTMREALYSQDGWGGQNVNQDSNWDIPGSPEPGSKDNGGTAPVPLWKLPINNGTDLWEANLRNGGLPPPTTQQTQKTPWGHTPSSNIGGTWGEDDEGDASNVWTGVPPAPAASGPQWPTQPPPIWPGKKEGDWSGPNWNDQRDPRDLRHSEMRQMMDARDHIRPTSIDHRSMGGNDLLLRGDPRGITGRLNAVTSDAMWPGPAPHHHLPHNHGKLPTQPNQAVNQWGGGGGPPMKDMAGLGGKSTGWEEPSPPAQRRNMPNYDDGTSLWGGPQHPRPTLQSQNKVSHWKEMPAPGIGRGGLQCPPGRSNPSMKPDQPLWAHHPRNGGGWGDTGMDGGPWGDDKPTASAGPWVDQSLAPSSWQGGPKHKPAWDGSDLDPASWGHSKQPTTKAISKEFIWTSKQFRILSEMGFKKEDIENSLRSCGMNLEDALDQLNTTRSLERWPRHADLDPDHAALMNFPSPQQTICLAPYPGGGGSGSGAGGPGGPTLATITPAVMQKLLAQQPPQQQPFAQQSSRTQQTQQPSAQQLRMLVQQIQMAVQGGYLSPQILNQPLAPQTLLLLNQLLQQIKQLQQLMQHHTVMQVNPLAKPTNNHILQLSVQITKTKQQITNLQNQIAAQQAVYVKHQQQTPPTTTEFFKPSLHEPISSLHSNFSDLTLKEPPTGGTNQAQSRLNQWKLPALDKDTDLGSGGEFSRAPGSTAKSAPGSSSPNTLLLGQADGTWSSVNRESGWPDSTGDDSSGKDWPNSSQNPSQAYSDLVPEFEPGKPWKGNPLKTIEDDPSLTPGSVVRSPLSLPALKDSHILSSSTGGGKASPTTSSSLDIMPLGLSSSTWSFNPTSSSSSNNVKLNSSGGSGTTSANGAGKNNSSTWETNSSDLWAPKRGPPPGLPAKPNSSSGGQAANGWSALSGSGRWSTSQGWPGPNQPAAAQTGSTWLLLRNLTPQIDGSTLKTLCLQHGPLSNFHLYLNHGIALAKYTSREEANKAQGALNNCVLGNTTIFAESPSESDVLSLLQHLGGQGGGSGGSAWRGKEPSWGNSQLWGGGGGSGGASSLWPGDNDQHRNTPSSINSFLPGDLLGGESI